MLEVLQALAIRFSYLRGVAILVASGFVILILYAALTTNAPEFLLKLGLIGLTWGLLLFSFVSTFQNVPPHPGQDHGGWQKFSLRIRRFGYAVLAMATLAITVAVIVVTFKLL